MIAIKRPIVTSGFQYRYVGADVKMVHCACPKLDEWISLPKVKLVILFHLIPHIIYFLATIPFVTTSKFAAVLYNFIFWASFHSLLELKMNLSD